MGCFTAGYYHQVKEYLHPHLHDFVRYYRRGNVFDLPLYHGCNRKIKMEPGSWLNMIRVINVLFQLITFIEEKSRINTKYKRREFAGQDTWHGPIQGICSKTKVTLFIIISLRSLNICLKHQCVMTMTACN